MNRIPRRLLPFVHCGVLLLAGACARQQAGPPARPPAAVRAAPAVKIDAPVIIHAFGNTKDRASVDIVPQVSGTLVKTLIEDGAVVTNGQPLFLIDSSDYAARVRQVEGVVAADRANTELSRTTLERNRPLLEKKLLSPEDFDVLKTKAEAAAAQLQMDEAALDQARLNLARCTVAAPIGGVCSKRNVDTGNLVAAGLTKLTNVRSYDPMYVDFSVSEENLPLLRQALAAGPVRMEVTPRGDTNAYPGTVEFMDNTVSTQTGTIMLRGVAPNPGLKLWAGQFVAVALWGGVVRDAVMVPEGAVQFGKQGTYLFVVSKENLAELRPVKPGVRYNDLIQIVEGVAPGDSVVVLGQLMLYPGASVADTARAPAAAPAGGASAPGGK